MEDKVIVDLYWERSENAILETSKKYGKLCYSIAYNILRNSEDSEECVNDTYFDAWNSMPTKRPDKLTPFLAKITRNRAINKYEYNNAQKRGGYQIPLAIDELENYIFQDSTTEIVTNEFFLADIINKFLDSLSEKNRDVFMSRYWEMRSITEIATIYGLSENSVKVTLHRLRENLKEILEKEELFI